MSLQHVYIDVAGINSDIAYFAAPNSRCFDHMLVFKMVKILLILKIKLKSISKRKTNVIDFDNSKEQHEPQNQVTPQSSLISF